MIYVISHIENFGIPHYYKKLDILKETKEMSINCKIEDYTDNKVNFSGKNNPNIKTYNDLAIKCIKMSNTFHHTGTVRECAGMWECAF